MTLVSFEMKSGAKSSLIRKKGPSLKKRGMCHVLHPIWSRTKCYPAPFGMKRFFLHDFWYTSLFHVLSPLVYMINLHHTTFTIGDEQDEYNTMAVRVAEIAVEVKTYVQGNNHSLIAAIITTKFTYRSNGY